jgi:hypothetical protein
MLIPRDFIIIYTVVLLAFVFVCAFFLAFYINLLSETPAWRYLISSALIAVVTFWITGIICTNTLEPLLWFERDNSWRETLWDHRPEMIAALVAALSFAGWQFLVRKRRCPLKI